MRTAGAMPASQLGHGSSLSWPRRECRPTWSAGRRWLARRRSLGGPEPFLVEELASIAGPVLDVAAGDGRNALWLARQGLRRDGGGHRAGGDRAPRSCRPRTRPERRGRVADLDAGRAGWIGPVRHPGRGSLQAVTPSSGRPCSKRCGRAAGCSCARSGRRIMRRMASRSPIASIAPSSRSCWQLG